MYTSNYLKPEKNYFEPSVYRFVFAFKGQPFASAVTNSTPTFTLIDFGMVQDFRMKMRDLKCQKFTFANAKLRIVGKVSSFVQYIKDDAPIGQYKFASTVVRGLTEALDVDSIAGTKLVSQLTGKPEDTKPSPVLDTEPSPGPATETSQSQEVQRCCCAQCSAYSRSCGPSLSRAGASCAPSC